MQKSAFSISPRIGGGTKSSAWGSMKGAGMCVCMRTDLLAGMHLCASSVKAERLWFFACLNRGVMEGIPSRLNALLENFCVQEDNGA